MEGIEVSKELDYVAGLLGGFLAKEDPEEAARILTCLDQMLEPVVRALPGEARGEVVHHLFRIRTGGHGLMRQTVEDLGGIEAVTGILNDASRATERDVLRLIDEHDPKLAEELRNRMFTFADIVQMNDKAIHLIMLEWEAEDIAIVLKGAGELMVARALSNVPGPKAETIQEAMASMGPIRETDVRKVQLGMVITVRQLVEAGQITTEREPYVC